MFTSASRFVLKYLNYCVMVLFCTADVTFALDRASFVCFSTWKIRENTGFKCEHLINIKTQLQERIKTKN